MGALGPGKCSLFFNLFQVFADVARDGGQLRGAYFDHVGFLCIKIRMGIRRNLLLHFTKGLPRCKCIMDRFVI